MTESRGVKVWNGELAVEQTLNAEVTTAFPVDQAVGDLAPGVYVMTAIADRLEAGAPLRQSLATQWFIVSDLGLAALFRQRRHQRVRQFARHDRAEGPGRGAADRRAATKSSPPSAATPPAASQFEAGPDARRGRARARHAGRAEAKGDYAFLSLKGPAFDLTDRGVSGRTAPAGLDAFVYTERGVYRSGETVHITALLRDAPGRGVARTCR